MRISFDSGSTSGRVAESRSAYSAEEQHAAEAEEQAPPTKLETAALVIGYAMSRLDSAYLTRRKVKTWQQAYQEAADALSEPTTSFNHLRDEFDPVHPNARRGWHNRPLRPSRERVMNELAGVSDEALMEMVSRILQRDEAAVAQAMDALAVVTRTPANVAERLLTGKRAEEHFLANTASLISTEPEEVVDLRESAGGFDFGIRSRPEMAVEVKGLKLKTGGILFTDREWQEAERRRRNYILVIIGNLAAEPIASIIADPYTVLNATCIWQTSVSATWRSSITL